MADSDFWNELAERFRTLATRESGRELRASWSCALDQNQQPGKKQWHLIGTGPGWLGSSKTIKVEFEALARRGGIKIDPSVDSLDAWFEGLSHEGPEDVTHGEGTQQNENGEVIHHRFGTINRVCATSADFCKALEARALEAERKANRDEQQRHDPKNWSPLRQNWEALKGIRQLRNGPHEEIPEAFVRRVLGEQYGVKPEQVTWEQMQFEIAGLLRDYPAIRLIPSQPVGAANEAARSSEQPLPALSREALQRIEQAEKNARAQYDQDKMPFFPTNPDFSFFEASIVRSKERILEYIRIFAEEVLEAHLKEYLEVGPSDLISNGAVRESLARSVFTLTDELWTGYNCVLFVEPGSRRARCRMATFEKTIDQYPELEPWRYPEDEQWAETWQKMTVGEDSIFGRLSARCGATIGKAVADGLEIYQEKAAARLGIKLNSSRPHSHRSTSAAADSSANVPQAHGAVPEPPIQMQAEMDGRCEPGMPTAGASDVQGNQLERSFEMRQGLEDEFSRMLTDVLTLQKTDGRLLEQIKARVSSKGIMIMDVTLPIEIGDTLLRVLPNGLKDEFVVEEPGYQSGLPIDGLPAHFQVRVRRPDRPVQKPAQAGEQIGSGAENSPEHAPEPPPPSAAALAPTPDPVRPRRTPNLDSSRERLALVETLARELAIVKQEVKVYCTVDSLKRKHPKFNIWTLIEDSQIKALVDGEEFTPKAYAENLTLAKFGLTSRETLKKDRRKLRKAKQVGQQ